MTPFATERHATEFKIAPASHMQSLLRGIMGTKQNQDWRWMPQLTEVVVPRDRGQAMEI